MNDNEEDTPPPWRWNEDEPMCDDRVYPLFFVMLLATFFVMLLATAIVVNMGV